MKKVTLLTVLMVLVISVSLAFGFGIPKLKGTLKPVDKEIKLGDLNPQFKKFEGTDVDPWKAAPLKVKVYGDAGIDGFILSSAKLPATLKFSNACLAGMNKKLAEAKTADEVKALEADAKILQASLTNVVTESTKLIASGTKLVTETPKKFKSNPMDLKHIKAILTSLKDSIANLKTVPNDAKTAIAGVTSFLTAAAAKGKELAAGAAG